MKQLLAELKDLRRKPDGDVYDPDIKKIAARLGTDHKLAQVLWDERDTATQALAIYIVDGDRFTERMAEKWVKGIGEWGICDSFTAKLIRPKPFAVPKAHEWAEREREYERRAAFSLMAQMAWQENGHADAVFIEFLPVIEKFAHDERLYVKKAVNWALRDIGKRNANLQKHARKMAQKLSKSSDKIVRWVGTHRISEID
ncbi:MAG TPA: DNA alkylation repair protein [Patescibacteria group bacterium]|nr:DNA alkylation repair protein [Patescibacteria group bacterium]